jgi:hypothetical protein
MLIHQIKISSLTILMLLGMVWSAIGQNPGWVAPNPAGFAYNATAICGLTIDSYESNSTNDRVAFFVGTELRGLGTPVDVGFGQILHFVTLYSNAPIVDMDVKIYQHSSGLVYNDNQKFKFKTQDNTGSIEDPYTIAGYTGGDSPIGINLIPDMTTFQNVAFETLDLEDYLVQPDNTPVVWSYIPNPNLNVTINGSLLDIEPIGNFFGTTSIIVRVTEQSPNQKSSDALITLHVDQAFDAPFFVGIPNQGILLGQEFTDFDLNDYEDQYNGNCLDFDYVPVIEQAVPSESFPDWSFVSKPKTNMTFTVQCNFTPKHTFNHPGDRMAFFTNNQLRAVSFPVTSNGKTLYFVTMGGDEPETDKIEIRFYSGAIRKVFTLLTDYKFIPHGVVGAADTPFVIDFSPLIPTVDADGTVHIMVADTTWTGQQQFVFKAADCEYPQYIFGQSTVSFCVLENMDNTEMLYYDADGDGFGSPAKPMTACVAPDGAWVDNNLDCNDDDPNVVALEVLVDITENSGTPNDGIICGSTNVNITASGGSTYLWSNGLTTDNIAVNPDTSIQYLVTVTSVEGCIKDTFATLTVESNVVTSTLNSGPGSLRNVLGCVVDGGIVYFDQPITNHNVLTESLEFTKSVTIIGLSPNIRPYIGIDFTSNDPSIILTPGKVLNLQNVDLHIINQNDDKPFFTETGNVVISGITKVVEID